jgi:hypothetical protein
MMNAKAPPVPPAGRSPKGPGNAASRPHDDTTERVPPDLEKQGQQGNVNVNTHNQGHQQDR